MNLMEKFDHMISTPIAGIKISAGTLSTITFIEVMELTGTIFGAIATVCAAIVGMRSVYIIGRGWYRSIKEKLKK